MWAIPAEWFQAVMVILTCELGVLIVTTLTCAVYLSGILKRMPKAPEAASDGRMAPGPVSDRG